MKFNSHISLIREPLALRIEGFRGPLRALQEELRARIRVRNELCTASI